MNARCFAVLVNAPFALLKSLKSELKGLSLETYSVGSWEEARHLIPRVQARLPKRRR